MYSACRVAADERVHLLLLRASGKVASRYALCGASPIVEVLRRGNQNAQADRCDDCARASGLFSNP